jgi:ABC-type glycerol-3-phosphate transport system substrate-binding protein
MKKRILAVAISLLLVVSVASGCATGKTVSTPKGPAKVSITVGMWPDSTDTTNVTLFKGFQAEFELKYPGVTIVPDNYTYAVDTFLAKDQAGTAPNVFETWYTEPQKLIKNGLVANITPELEKLGWDKQMNSDIKTMMSDSSGQIYGIPRDAYVLGLMVNLNLFKQAGLTNADGTAQYPKTFAQLETVSQTIKAKTGKAGLALLGSTGAAGWHFANIAWNFGAKLENIDASGNATSNLASPEAIQAMTYVQKLYNDKVLTADPTKIDWAGGFVALGTGQAAMVIAANDAVSQPTTTNGLGVKDLALVPMPAGPGGDDFGLMGGTPYMFSKQSTPAQITAGLNWIQAIGKAPVTSADALSAMEQNDAALKTAGTPNIYPVDAWTTPSFVAEEHKAVDDNSNVNMANFNDYFTWENTTGVRHIEEPGDTQDMYNALTNVIQAVVTTPGVNVTTLMTKANSDFTAKMAAQ